MKIKTKNVTDEDFEEIQDYMDKKNKNKNKKNMTRNPINEFTNSYSVRDFTCKSENQKKIIKSICNSETIITVVHGQAGTGKTFSAIQGMLKQFKSAYKSGEGYNKIYLLKSLSLAIASSFLLTKSPSMVIFFISMLSGKSKRISSSKVVRIVCKRLAPIFSTSSLT